MSDIVKGAVVQLKSGGPQMTVEDVGNYAGQWGTGPENGAKCVWFEKSEVKEKVFDVEVLTLA
ncbi:MAG: DUF2158 domain-containing protein [Pseudomonas piscis]|uniref:DUF2158 domain-containing protein n=1 Tax=Pseudomonas TaxID=286 RepID=UPI000A1E6AFD|nr:MULTISPECIES: DUF2158 domain-containing protein [unclassified Pseudomonas]